MFLKTLSIKGFKSFADAASLQMEPGVTVVVGPNGSGKSNVVDAIGWVLGAQAPSAVRSQKMDDVIFAGSSKRPALGRAEVSLTIDNSSGVLPIEFSEVTITRVLFRSGDSEYSINGVPCRLLDIQELLSDSGVGRQQHVIISQGQIDAVLNAKPEERRLIIEEAAGILKFRKRKEKSERRLASTEANLIRIQDMLREIRRQLKPLERQADAARRHADVVAELTTLRIHLAGRELARLRAQLQDSIARQGTFRAEERGLRSQLASLDTEVMAVEAELSTMGGPDSSDALVRYESLRERGRGLAALAAERRRGVERDREAFVDQAVVASLEVERAAAADSLATVLAEQAELAVERSGLIGADAELAQARERFETDWGGGADAAVAEVGELRGELSGLRTAMRRTDEELERLVARGRALDDRQARVAAELARSEAELEEQRSASDSLRVAVSSAEARLVSADANLVAADAAAAEAAAEHRAWVARAEALTLALDQARRRAGAERLAGVAGVVGTLLDAVDIDAGWESAVEAAAADALGAVVVDSPEVARTALALLAENELSGAVLALGGPTAAVIEPTEGESVRRHVRSTRPGVDALLDRLLADAVCVAGPWTAAADLSIRRPDLTVVTRAGDRCSRSGWALRVAGAGATGSALEEATDAVVSAAAGQVEADAVQVEARAEHRSAVEAEREALRTAEANSRAVTGCESAIARLRAQLDEVSVERAGLEPQSVELGARRATESSRIEELAARLPALEAAEAHRVDQEHRQAEARRTLEAHATRVAALHSDLDVRLAATTERERSLTARLEQLEERLLRHQDDRLIAQRRHRELDARAEVLDTLHRFVGVQLESIESVLGELREARRVQSERTRSITTRLDELRRTRSAAEKQLEVVRERLQRGEIEDTETKLRIEGATATCRDELDCEPDVAMSTPCPSLPDGVSAPARARELDRDVRIMGPINPLALEEFAALQERHTFFEQQLEDIRDTRRELAKVIRAVDEEIVSVFSAAYADVSQNFVALFDMLFPGGTGGLRLTEPHDLLNTGIEIEAKPSGKNVKKLSLLSGGERSLTALAYLFSVFRSRPSPFYVMDEVEAALDDVNLHRFLGLVAEFRDAAQLIIVSHQKRTMEAADVLYGVTMEPGGSSKVLSERVGALLD